jgi:hypothetical protein
MVGFQKEGAARSMCKDEVSKKVAVVLMVG